MLLPGGVPRCHGGPRRVDAQGIRYTVSRRTQPDEHQRNAAYLEGMSGSAAPHPHPPRRNLRLERHGLVSTVVAHVLQDRKRQQFAFGVRGWHALGESPNLRR